MVKFMFRVSKYNCPLDKGCELCPVGIYLLKDNKRNTKTSCEICSKLTMKTSKGRHWRRETRETLQRVTKYVQS